MVPYGNQTWQWNIHLYMIFSHFPIKTSIEHIDFQLPCLITSWCDVTLGRFAVWWQDLHGDWVKHWILTIQAWQRSNVPRFQCRRVVKECTH